MIPTENVNHLLNVDVDEIVFEREYLMDSDSDDSYERLERKITLPPTPVKRHIEKQSSFDFRTMVLRNLCKTEIEFQKMDIKKTSMQNTNSCQDDTKTENCE